MAIRAQADGISGQIGRVGIGSFNVSLLRPICPVAREDVNRARVQLGVIILVTIDTLSAAVLGDGAGGKSITVGAQTNREPKSVSIRELIAHAWFAGIRSFDVCLLRPGRSCSREDVYRPGLWDGVVVLVAVHTFGRARLARCRDGQRVAVLAERHNE